MNLNDFVVLPNKNAVSVKLNSRNLQDLQMETETLTQESKEMEEKLQQLKERMSKEKEERGNSGGFRWKSGKCGPLMNNAQTDRATKNKENKLQKLSEGKLKIRVLKDEPLTVRPKPPPQPPAPSIGLKTKTKNRLRGKCCGQCEVKTAGLMCAECTEDYCIGCFTKFHQKGALKLHRIIPIQTDLQTHVSTRDVVSCIQKQYNPNSYPAPTSPKPSPKSKPRPDLTSMSNALTIHGDKQPGEETEVEAKPMQLHHDNSQQVFHVSHEEKKEGMMEERPKSDRERGFSTFLLRGEFNEEESARSFQEALRQWRGEKRDVAGETMSEEAMWTPVRPVSVSAMGTQTGLASDRGTKGRGKGEGEDRVPFRVEFTENSLTYMDRLLLKKHRRTPIEAHSPSLAFESDLKSQPNPDTEEETASSLTAEEEDFRRYFASLFAVPHSRGRTDPQTTTPESCLIIEVLDERDRDIGGVFIRQQRKDNNGKFSPGQQVLSNGRATVPQTPLTNASSSESKSSACSTAETPRALKKSIKTPTIMSHKPYCSPTVYKSKPDCGSPQLVSSLSLQDQTRIPMSSHSPTSFQPDVSPLASATPILPEEPRSPSPSISFSLRSTFTVSPSSSTESPLLPTVNQLTPPQIGSDSSLLPVQPQSSQLFSQSVSSVRLSQSSPSNLLSQRQSQQSLCDPEFLLSHHQLQLPQSPVSPSPNPPPRTLEPCQAVRPPPGAYSRHASTPTNQDTPIVMSFTSISGDHESTASQQDTQCIPSLLSHNFVVSQDSPLALKVEEEEEEELSIDSGDDMSSDSLGLAPHEDDSSDEDTQMHGRLMREETREEERAYLAISHPDDSLVAAEREKELQTDEQEQLSEPAMVMQRRSVGSGSEQFCDLDGFLPLGLDINSGHSDTADHTHRDSLHTSRTSLNESELAESEDFGPSSSLTSRTEEHLAIRLMKGSHTQPTEIKIRSTTPTRRGEISATELRTSVLGPVLSQAAKEILEICCVDKAGCEDPDLDNDTTENTLHDLEQELRLMTKGKQNSILGSEKHGSQGQHGEHRLTPGRVREEQKDEEAAAQRDQQSVLLLP